MIKRLKKLGASQSEMTDVYIKQMRCLLELAVAVWMPGLTKAESYQLERVQKCVAHVIMGDAYDTYDGATNILGLEKLSDRRFKLCLNFARKCDKHPKY